MTEAKKAPFCILVTRDGQEFEETRFRRRLGNWVWVYRSEYAERRNYHSRE
jgi:hypothetical protein